jgi:hypothetical protein
MRKSITDLASVTTIGLDLAKHVFQVRVVAGQPLAVSRDTCPREGARQSRPAHVACLGPSLEIGSERQRRVALRSVVSERLQKRAL